jgi:GT2 family glycosyltransferase
MEDKKVVMVIATCNEEDLFNKCIDSIVKNTDYINYKIYVIDDSGKDYLSDKTKTKLKNIKNIHLHINEKNKGLPYTFNWGMERAFKVDKADYCALLNDDLVFKDKYWLWKLTKILKFDNTVGAVHPKMVNPDGSLQYFYKNKKTQFAQYKNNIEETEETNYVVEQDMLVGTCLLFKKEVYDEIGGWDLGFSPIYGEDSDWSLRVNKKGFKQLYVGNVKVIHYGGGSSDILFKDFNDKKWYLQKAHGIRVEWLNFSLFKIIKHTIIHLGSAIFSRHLFKKLKLLFKAYRENINNIKEIREKRKERNSWRKINEQL